jgi:hypothetical protein
MRKRACSMRSARLNAEPVRCLRPGGAERARTAHEMSGGLLLQAIYIRFLRFLSQTPALTIMQPSTGLDAGKAGWESFLANLRGCDMMNT